MVSPAPVAGPWVPPPRPLPTSTKGPTVMLLAGILALLLAVGAAVAAGFGIAGLSRLGTDSERLSFVTSDDGAIRAVLPALEPGTEYVLCSAMSLPSSGATITADSATGSPLAVRMPMARVNVTINGFSRAPQLVFTAGDATEYVVTLDTDLAMVSSSGVWLATYAPFQQFGWNLAVTVVGIIASVFCGLAGLGLTIGGGVWRSRRSRNARRVAATGQQPATTAPVR